jgi:hypothetical protein
VRIYDSEGNEFDSILVALTDAEAAELRDSVEALLKAGDGFHAHVSASDFQTELTIFRADDPTVAARFENSSR